MSAALGIVVIGRNEGARLARCLDSVAGAGCAVVYVDSGSSDASVPLARGRGATVVELDPREGFSAARARNAGYRRLQETGPGPSFVQFVDGDCELMAGWLEAGARVLQRRAEVAAVAGRLRERAPEFSVYNRIGELEWNQTAPGEADSVGGIFMVRCAAFDQAGGFDASVPAGEEPELCDRLRRLGWTIWREDREMAWHDLAIAGFGQWWVRMVRTGYGSMDVAARFGLARFRRINRRARAWAAWLAIALLGVVAALLGYLPAAVPLAVTLLWPAQVARIALRTASAGQPAGTALAYAALTMIAFVPQIAGQATWLADRVRNRAARLVEYKASA